MEGNIRNLTLRSGTQPKKTGLLQRAFMLLCTLLCTLLWISVASAQPPKVTFFAPHAAGTDPFWTEMTHVTEAAAEDLGIDLRVVYSNPNTYSLKKDGLAALNDPDKPGYFLTGYWTPTTRYHLEQAEELGIRTFIFNSGITSSEEREQTGEPREKLKYWIGQMTPDEVQVGYTLADALIVKAKAAGKTGKDDKVHVVALGGYGDGLEQDRLNGLKKRIAEQDDAVFEEFILAGWTEKGAYKSLIDILPKQPAVSVVWSMSDTMALGAITAAKELGRVPGRDIFIGGVDWNPQAIEAIKNGDMTASMGGHFVEGAFALILIHDYHYNLDFAGHPGIKTHTRLQAVTTDNIKQHLRRLSGLDWRKIDFKRFSKKYNPGLKNYDFSLDALLNSLGSE